MSPCRAEARAEDARSALTRGPSRSYPWWSPSIRPQPTHTCFRRAQDAASERFFDQVDSQRTIFQYTLQQYLPGKVTTTIEKLRANDIDFFELVVVTPHSVSSETQTKMQRTARSDHGVRLDIFDRKTLLSRLADLENGIFHRHFPNIKGQLEDIVRSADRAAIPHTQLDALSPRDLHT